MVGSLARHMASLPGCLKMVAAVACRNKNNKNHPTDMDKDNPTNSSRRDNNSIPIKLRCLRAPAALSSAVGEV